MFKEILSKFTCSGTFCEIVNALACYVLVAVAHVLFLSMTILLVLALTLNELIAIVFVWVVCSEQQRHLMYLVVRISSGQMLTGMIVFVLAIFGVQCHGWRSLPVGDLVV